MAHEMEAMDAQGGEVEVQLAQTRQRVSSLEQTFQSFANNMTAQISALSTKLDERSRTPWATILAAMGVVLAVVTAGGQLAKAPIDQAIVRLERDTANTVPMDRFIEFKSTYENNRVIAKQDVDAKFNRIEQELNMQVPRGEHERIWQATDAKFGDIQRQIDEIKKAFGDTFSLRDALLQMQNRIDKLELEKMGRGGPA